MAAKATANFAKMSDEALAEAVIGNWQHMTKVLPKVEERDVYRLLKYETENRGNKAILIRLHQRWTRLRASRERKFLLSKDMVLPK